MTVTVELFGIARSRAGVDRTSAVGKSLGDVLADLAARYPGLKASCIDGRRLRSGFTVNLGGERFTTDPATLLKEGDIILLMSVDSGG